MGTPYLLSRRCLLFAGALLTGLACKPSGTPGPGDRSSDFDAAPQSYPVAPGIVDEASGLADSRTLDGYLWTHQDSGYPSELFLVSKDAKTIKKFPVPGTSYLDWEDIAAGPGPEPGVHYLYIGDIGSNAHPNRPNCTINRVKEISSVDGSFTADAVEKIIYRYPDGPRDAETLMIDPDTKDLYIVSKEAAAVNLYRLPYPQPAGQEMTAERIGAIPGIKADGIPPTLVTSPVSGDISFDGKEIIIKSYTTIFYWKREEGQSIADVLTSPALKTLPYLLEPEGTGICFDRNAAGYFTLSERAKAAGVTLNYYKRK